jgi:uncharacterized membrane protein (DUF106 family)
MEALVISGIAVTASLISTLIQKKLIDTELVKSLRSEIKKLQKEMRKHRQDAKKVNELMRKSFDLQKKMMRHTMKPTLISWIIILIAVIPLTYFFGGFLFGDFKLYFILPFSFPIVGKQLAWIWVFIIASIISSLIFRKIFDLGY